MRVIIGEAFKTTPCERNGRPVRGCRPVSTLQFKPKQTLPCTERQGSSEASWNTMARSGPGPVTSLPSTRIEPRARISPARASNSVLFAQPLDPTMVTKELFSTERVMPWIAAKVSSLFGFLYSIATSRISIWLIALDSPAAADTRLTSRRPPQLFRLPLVDRGHEPVVPVFFLGPRRIDVAGRDGHVEEFAHPVIGGEPPVLAPAIDQQVIARTAYFSSSPARRPAPSPHAACRLSQAPPR